MEGDYLKEKMSPYLHRIVVGGKPKLPLTKLQLNMHIVGLSSIGFLLHDDFFDIPLLPPEPVEGVFHTIEYLSDTVAFSDNNTKTQLVTVHQFTRDPSGVLSSHCPLNLKMEFYDVGSWIIKVHDTTSLRTVVTVLLSCKEGTVTTDYENYKEIKLSSLLSNATLTGGLYSNDSQVSCS